MLAIQTEPPSPEEVAKAKASEPRYRQLSDALCQGIYSGRYPVGSQLPTEKELCEQYSISRHTAREALRVVERLGLIERRQGSGSTVLAATPPAQYNQVVQSINDLLQYGNASRFIIDQSEVEAVSDTLAPLLGWPVGTPCIHMHGLRYQLHDNRPFALTDIYFANPTNASHRSALLDPRTRIFKLLEVLDPAQLGLVEQTFTAVNLSEDEANALHKEAGFASFKVTRRYFDMEDRFVALAISLHPGDLFSYTTVLRRS